MHVDEHDLAAWRERHLGSRPAGLLFAVEHESLSSAEAAERMRRGGM